MMYRWRNALPPWSTAEHGPWTTSKCNGHQQLVDLLTYELCQMPTNLVVTVTDLVGKDRLRVLEQAIEVEEDDRTRRMLKALQILLA